MEKQTFDSYSVVLLLSERRELRRELGDFGPAEKRLGRKRETSRFAWLTGLPLSRQCATALGNFSISSTGEKASFALKVNEERNWHWVAIVESDDETCVAFSFNIYRRLLVEKMPHCLLNIRINKYVNYGTIVEMNFYLSPVLISYTWCNITSVLKFHQQYNETMTFWSCWIWKCTRQLRVYTHIYIYIYIYTIMSRTFENARNLSQVELHSQLREIKDLIVSGALPSANFV